MYTIYLYIYIYIFFSQLHVGSLLTCLLANVLDINALSTPTEVVYGAMIPEPDYSDDERETQPASVSSMVARNNKVNT